MKYFKYLLFFSSIPVLFGGCGQPEWNTALYAQPIEGTSKILYKYDASGGRDTMVSGYILLDSTETFSVDISKNLPFSYLEEIPNKHYIKGVESENPNYDTSNNREKKVFTPIKNSKLFENEIEIKIKTYQYNGFSTRNQGLGQFEFESFKETRDSLFFYNLDDIKSLEPMHLDSLKIKKTNVVIKQTKNSEVIQIDIKDLILAKKTNEVISNKTYFLTPKNKMKSDSFSNYGIFKSRE